MSEKTIHQTYKKHMVVAMLIYIVGAVSVAYLRKKTGTSVPVLAIIALISGAGVVMWIWAHARYIGGLDEFIQKLHFHAVLISTGILLAITTFFGVLEEFVKSPDIPVLPVMYLVPLFCFIYAPVLYIIGRRNGVKGLCL
ncbi:MAG: hypothetical protein HKO02_13465 [Hyphomonadaceae bacterium]|nr:hypothetical protein [Hyphomonadaceae bacterium]